MTVLSNLKPKDVFKYFEDICGIPHGSGNLVAIAAYCTDFAKKHGLSCECDNASNVLIRKPASKDCKHPDTIILQGHLDMVCEKEAGLDFDFKKDPILPRIDGDRIYATGTTLGGDNGIAVAMMLALLADENLSHPALEILLTADEETNMGGAFAFDCNKLSGHKLINLDSEVEGVLMCSCAGGVSACSRVPVTRDSLRLMVANIEINGLKGGHSGVEIDKGRANSNVLAGRLLKALSRKLSYRLIALEGGKYDNAIASYTKLVVGIPSEKADLLKALIPECCDTFRKEYETVEPNMNISLTLGEEQNVNALSTYSTELVHKVLISLPDGVQEMSVDMPGLVQTSVNFGILKLNESELYCLNSVRSSMTTQKHMVFDKIAAIVSLAGGRTEAQSDYPGWAYNPNSELKDVILAEWKKLTGSEASVEAVHAGIECGLFSDSIKDLDCVSIGPDMGNVHTPNEYLSISSTSRTYELLKAVLAAIAKGKE